MPERLDYAQVIKQTKYTFINANLARHSVDAGYDVVIFDQQADLGGTWLYSPEINSFSSLYEKMYTNLPKEIMGFEHLPFETDCPESFVRHQEVLAFLRRYGKPIRHLIHVGPII